MFGTKSRIETAKKESARQSQLDFADCIRSWHEEYSRAQSKLESRFDFNDLDKLSINVWDEFKESEDWTYAYVELSDVPDKACFDILFHLYQFMMPAYADQISIRYFDSTTKYPEHLLDTVGRRMSFKRWEIFIVKISSTTLAEMVEAMQAVPDFKGKSFDIYSES